MFLAWARPGTAATRHVIAVAQMLMGALLIHLSGGRIEAHFHVFASLAFLAIYRDWRVLVTATIVVVLDHFFRNIFWPRSVFGVLTTSPWRWLEHAGWVLCEDIVLVFGCLSSVHKLRLFADRQAETEASRERIERANDALQIEVAERRKAEEEALRARGAAESASRTKSEFLANMSHGIRTPMNGILGMTELALDTELSPRQREYLGIVQSSAEALLTLISDILDFSKIEAGKLDLDPVPFELRGTFEETMGTLAHRAHSTGLELACRIAPDVPDALVGDPGRLRQILVNLVGNAIKFTERGEVLVDVRREQIAGGGVGLRISVADTGIGIAPEKQCAIFEPFEQADGSMTRRYGGTGLGLAISVKLVERMGGRIWVESEPGRGSTFHFTVRLERQPSDDNRRGMRILPGLEDMPVLIVDDNATNRRILEEVLTNWGARPVSVAGGPEALAALRAASERGEPFPIALIDGMMPEMSGLDLAERVRADRDLAGLDLLMLTSAGGPDDTGRYLSLGLSACLSKPIRQSELYDALMKALDTPGKARDGATALQSVDERRSAPAATTGGLHLLLAEDQVVNQKVAVRMLEGLGHSVIVAVNGRKALQALETCRFDAVLMDVQMPEMDGGEAVKAIRAGERGTGFRLPVIALTAHAMKGDRERFLSSGFDAYLSKPIRAKELSRVLQEHAARTAVEAPQAGAEPAWEQLLTICAGDPEFAGEVAEVFLATAPRLVAGISGAIEAGDADRLAAEAHGLKGISLTIGAEELGRTSRVLEEAGRRSDLSGARATAPECQAAWEVLRVALVGHARR